jgi:hypothetical protein
VRLRTSLLLVEVLLGCHRSPTLANGDPHALIARYPIRAHVRWTEWRDRGGQVSSRKREERWTPRGTDTWDVVTSDVEGPAPPYHARYALLPAGLAQISVVDKGTDVPVTPPRLSLPSDARAGVSWDGEHHVGNQTSKRKCKLVAYDKCNGGIEEQCTTTFGDGRQVDVHNRWCAGVGQVSYWSVTRAPGAEGSVRIWSEDLVDVAPPPG